MRTLTELERLEATVELLYSVQDQLAAVEAIAPQVAEAVRKYFAEVDAELDDLDCRGAARRGGAPLPVSIENGPRPSA